MDTYIKVLKEKTVITASKVWKMGSVFFFSIADMEYNSSTRLTEPLTDFSFGTICYLQDQKR